ncbi:hypothetical protein HMPREF0557_02786 [Listeria innocua ATCC 33091]|uniref:Uncharacterized protein n=1 Tax=Listeria innocua ATCC 33091 TaxID=1002366 RepID=A0AB72Z6G0_LISIO|nr:hypothetical protein HMPREF0557_02786 [Listeria innocua ATCC 33091]
MQSLCSIFFTNPYFVPRFPVLLSSILPKDFHLVLQKVKIN